MIASITDTTTVHFAFERKRNRCSGFKYRHILVLLLDMEEIFGPGGFTKASSGFVGARNQVSGNSERVFHSPMCKGATLGGLKRKMTPDFSVAYKGTTLWISLKLLRFQRERFYRILSRAGILAQAQGTARQVENRFIGLGFF